MDFLLSTVFKATLVLLASCAVAVALRRASAAARSLLWTIAIIGLLVLPALSWILPSWHIPVGESDTLVGAVPPSGVEPLPLASPQMPVASPFPVAAAVFLLWTAGLAAVLGRFLLGIFRVRRVARAARPVDIADWRSLIADLTRSLRLRRPISLLESDRARLPMTWGLRHPVVLLPAGAGQWSAERRRLVLAHELTHVKRLAHLIQILAQFACGLYWFHPLVWAAAAFWRKERERACDDAVLRLGARGSDYAGHLLDLVRSLPVPAESWSTAIAMAQSSHLESRVIAMLNPNLNRRAVTRTGAVLAALAAAFLIVPLAVVGSPAQKAAGRLVGVVYDASGAAVPRAVVTAANAGHNTEIVSTNDAGEYAFAAIPAGEYALEVRKPGFALLRKDVVVNADSVVRQDLTLEVGRVSDTIDVIGKSPSPAQPPPAVTPRRIRVGGNVQATKLIYMAKPAYPEHAQQQGIEGTVLLRAVIGTDGSLLSLGVVNTLADPELAKAATDAVKQWRYQPTLLNGMPVEVVTTITVNFRLA